MGDFSKVPTSQHYHYSPPSLQNYYKISTLISFLFPTTQVDHSFLLQKLIGTSFFKIELKIMSEEREIPNDPSPPFKLKEKGGGGEGRSKAWWPMEGSKLGGQWKVKEKHFFTSSHFPPNNFIETFNFFFLKIFFSLIFSFDLKVLLYHDRRPLLTHLLPFIQFINYDCAFQCNKSSTPSLSIWFWLKLWFLSSPWSYGVAHGHVLRASSHTSEWRTAFGIISRFDPRVTFSWWKT